MIGISFEFKIPDFSVLDPGITVMRAPVDLSGSIVQISVPIEEVKNKTELEVSKVNGEVSIRRGDGDRLQVQPGNPEKLGLSPDDNDPIFKESIGRLVIKETRQRIWVPELPLGVVLSPLGLSQFLTRTAFFANRKQKNG